MYNYLKAMKEDVKEYVKNDAELTIEDLLYNRSVLEEKLHDDLWAEDSVTGSASGSYTFDRLQAQEDVVDNIDLLNEACEEFGTDKATIGEKFLDSDFEWMDVTIRCYLLGQAISEALEEIEEDFKEAEE